MTRPPPRSTLFPYTTLFRSERARFIGYPTNRYKLLGFVISAAVVAVAGELIARSEEHTSELQSQSKLVCRLLLEKKKTEILAVQKMNAGVMSRSRLDALRSV